MTENDTLHLWYKPYGGVMGDGDVVFVDRYSKRFYPKTMNELAKQLHRAAAKITKLCAKGTFEYRLRHYTRQATGRYVIEETLQDANDALGLTMGIQATTPEERRMFSECFKDEKGGGTTAVQAAVAYLEDSIENENHKWAGIKMRDGQDALPVLQEVIAFLKLVKNVVRVHTFEVTHSEQGIGMTIALVTPDVLAYYTRIDWNIG